MAVDKLRSFIPPGLYWIGSKKDEAKARNLIKQLYAYYITHKTCCRQNTLKRQQESVNEPPVTTSPDDGSLCPRGALRCFFFKSFNRIALRGAPFWAALDALLRSAGLAGLI